MTVLNPLYETSIRNSFVSSDSSTNGSGKNIATARIDNALPGVCPKCQTAMATSQLGQSMGNQRVFFCNTCRVASPIPTV
jgi:hypothetical protein